MDVTIIIAAVLSGLFLMANTAIGITSTRRLAREQEAREKAEKERDTSKDANVAYHQLLKDQQEEIARLRALLREKEK